MDGILSADCLVGALPHLVCCVELIAHGSPRYSRETGFLKKAEVFLHLWLINPRISHGIIGETGLLGDWL